MVGTPRDAVASGAFAHPTDLAFFLSEWSATGQTLLKISA
jgi:hypothetical protein